MILRKTFRFEASHVLPKHPGKCSRLHGHSWVLHVETEGERNLETGFVMDYADMSAAVKPIIDRLDHRHLGAWCVFLENREEAKNYSDSAKRMLLAEIWGHEEGALGEYFKNWQVPGMPLAFNPTSENLLYWIGEQLALSKFKWSKIALEETCTSYAELRLDEFMKWYGNTYGMPAVAEALSGW